MKYRHIILSTAILMPMCVILRALHIMYTVEGETGFINPNYATESFVLLAAIGVFVAVCAGLCFSVRRSPTKMPQGPLVAVGAIIAALGFAYELFAAGYPVRVPAWQVVSIKLFGAAVIAFMVFYAIASLLKTKMPSGLFAIPVIYGIVKLLVVFTEISAISVIPDSAFTAVSCCAVLWAFLQIAKQAVGIKNGHTHKLMLCSAMLAVFMCAISSLPMFAVMVVSPEKAVHGDLTLALTLFTTGVFIALFTLGFFSNSNLDEMPEYKKQRYGNMDDSAISYFLISEDTAEEKKPSVEEAPTVVEAKPIEEKLQKAPIIIEKKPTAAKEIVANKAPEVEVKPEPTAPEKKPQASPFKEEFIEKPSDVSEDGSDFSRVSFDSITPKKKQ